MKFFERAFKNLLRKDGEGRTVFFPWGCFGKGRIIDAATETRAHRLVAVHNAAWTAILLYSVFLAPDRWQDRVLITALAVMPALYHLAAVKILGDAPVSGLRITWREQFLRAHPLPLLVVFVASVILLFLFLGGISAADSGDKRLSLSLAALAFGAVLFVSGYGLYLKIEDAGRDGEGSAAPPPGDTPQ